jgi:hypothetical protein
MNTNPDETKLALWLDDELKGEELAAFGKWVADHPGHLAAREDTRRWRKFMRESLPAAEEPPYGEFFNARILRAVQAPADDRAPIGARPRSAWRPLLVPIAACAGMAFTFLLGARSQRSAVPEISVAGAPKAIPVEPILYTPERGVKAEWHHSAGASATVIVLNGVDAIPDETDFSRTVSLETRGEIDSTADAAEDVNDQPGS